MKHTINGKVTGHKLFHPDPKDNPTLELLRVEVDIAPVGKAFEHANGKKSTAVLILHLDDIKGFELGRPVGLTIADTQQRLALEDRAAHRERAHQGAEPR